MNKQLAIIGLVPAALLLTAASGYYVTPSKNKILWAETNIEPGTELTARKGDIIHRRPVGRAWVAVLGKEVALEIAGQKATLPAGMQLSVARSVTGDASKELNEPARVFCAPMSNNWNALKGLANLMTLSLFASTQRVGPGTQFCLADSDGDSSADKAFLAGAKRAEDLKPMDIAPVPVAVAQDVPLPGESEARIRFAGGVGIFGDIGFDLEVVEEGQKLMYNNGRTLVPKGKLPRDVTMFGASFTVLSYDPATKEARLRWNSNLGVGEYGVTTTTTTTYIPIYIPR